MFSRTLQEDPFIFKIHHCSVRQHAVGIPQTALSKSNVEKLLAHDPLALDKLKDNFESIPRELFESWFNTTEKKYISDLIDYINTLM